MLIFALAHKPIFGLCLAGFFYSARRGLTSHEEKCSLTRLADEFPGLFEIWDGCQDGLSDGT